MRPPGSFSLRTPSSRISSLSVSRREARGEIGRQIGEVRTPALRTKEKDGRDVLIYGHTYEPFAGESQTVANAGSWVKSEKSSHYNMFLVIFEDSLLFKKWIEGREKVIGHGSVPIGLR